MKPFTFRLWAALLAVIVCSGVVDYLTERTRVKETTLGKNTRVASHYSSPRNRQSIHLTLTRAPVLVILLVLTAASLYEYFAGFLWGGFAYPLSRVSAICTRPHVWIQPRRILHPAPFRFRRAAHSHAQLRVACEQRTDQIVGGFFFLVMISSCTREHWQRERAHLIASARIKGMPRYMLFSLSANVANRHSEPGRVHHRVRPPDHERPVDGRGCEQRQEHLRPTHCAMAAARRYVSPSAHVRRPRPRVAVLLC
jgi:hypothetical protein